MALGLEKFRSYFQDHEDKYVLIGGAACHILFDNFGLPFRVTKDLDIVLIVELIDEGFLSVFWRFIDEGGYEVRESSDGAPQLYRFSKPKAEDYPFMIELFSRRPDLLAENGNSAIGRLDLNGEEISLSAILLNEDYYQLLNDNRSELDGISLIGPEALIPFKARAFLDMRERKSEGQQVDSRHIDKHKKDVVRLSQLLVPTTRVSLSQGVQTDLSKFMKALAADESFEPKALGIAVGKSEIIDLLYSVYQIQESEE